MKFKKNLLEKNDMTPQALNEIAKAYDERTTKDIAKELEESRKKGIAEKQNASWFFPLIFEFPAQNVYIMSANP